MPFSSDHGKDAIRKIVNKIPHATAIDIGAGQGTYAKLFPDIKMDAVEIWGPYIEKYELKSLYGEVIQKDARRVSFDNKRYDICFFGDVLEHMPVHDARALVKRARKWADTVIVSIPLGYYPQDEYEGNPFEKHITDNWTDAEFRKSFGEPDYCEIDNFIGVYVWSKYNVHPIPNIIHMFWFSGENSRQFGFVNYLAIRAAREVQNPEHLYVYYNKDQPENPYWQAAKQYATFVQEEAPTEFGGVELKWPQYQADVTRLQKLYEQGGIYLDTDELLLKPLTQFMDKKCVLNFESKEDTIANCVMLAQPKNQFLGKWLEALPEALKSDVWAYHAVCLPSQLYKQHSQMVDLQPLETFLPFNWREDYIFGEDEQELAKLENSCGIHMWETIWKDQLAEIDDNYLLNRNTLFAKLFRKYAKRKPKICVYAISKNEAHFVPRFCESSKDADLILIADTGSTDGLPEVARAHGAVVHDICITPWRFDLARNAALALIPRDIDICISLDIDEVLQPGWREEIERVWTVGKTTRLRYMFDWGAGIQFYYEKIHARHGYMWHHPCHEYPVHDGRITEVWAQSDMLLAVHMPDPTKSRGQYLDLLELSVKEDPRCPRNAFYYARELSFHGKWQEAIEACRKYLAMPEATWENERCYAYRVMGRCWNEMGNAYEAEKAFHLAAAEAPNTREPWCELAMLTYRQGRWSECFAYAMRTLQITDRTKVYTCDPEVWGAQPHDLAAISSWHLGLRDVSIEQGEKALELAPGDARIAGNLLWYRGEAKSG